MEPAWQQMFQAAAVQRGGGQVQLGKRADRYVQVCIRKYFPTGKNGPVGGLVNRGQSPSSLSGWAQQPLFGAVAPGQADLTLPEHY
mgnify:CR=1 FL=1